MSRESILVTSIGSIAGETVISRLKDLGYRVVGTDVFAKNWIYNSELTEVFYQVPWTSNKEEYRKKIHEICNHEGILYIVPLTDVDIDFFQEERDWAEKENIHLCISPKYTLNVFRNKKETQDLIGNISPQIEAIPTFFLESAKNIKWEFPYVCKPYNGRSSQNLHIIKNQIEWEAFISCVEKDIYIVEPYIYGEIIVADVIRQPDYEECEVVLRKELIRTPHGCGLSVEIFRDADIEQSCRLIAKKMGIVGCVNFEMIKSSEGKLYFMECNPRFSAGVSFSVLAGYDVVANHMRCFQKKHIVFGANAGNIVMARRYIEMVTGK